MGIPWILGGVHRPDQSSPPCEESMPILWAGESDSRIAPKIENTVRGVKFDGAEFFAGGIWGVFGYSARASCPMDKWGTRLDSAHRIGLGSTSHDFFDCSGELQEGGEI